MKGRHRPGKGRISVAKLTAPACNYSDNGLYCTCPANHETWHHLAYPGTREVRYFAVETMVQLSHRDSLLNFPALTIGPPRT